MKRILPVVIIIILLIFIRNTALSIHETAKSETVKEKLEAQITEEKRRNQFLKERLHYVKTDEFIEREAKEKLAMLAPGEFFVIAPSEEPQVEEIVEFDDRPNWRKWWELFF